MLSPAPLVLVVSAPSGRVRRRFLPADRFWDRCLPASGVFITRSLPDLDRAVEAIRARPPQVIACLGGDGALHHLTGALLRHFEPGRAPVLLPLAGGTLNGLARAFGTGGAPEATLRAALTRIGAGPVPCRTLPVLEIADPAEPARRYGYTFAAGLPARACRIYYRGAPGARGVIRVSLLAAASAAGGGAFAAPDPLRLWIDGREAAPPHSFVAGVVDRPFLWFAPFGPAGPPGAAFRIAAASLPPRAMVPRLWRIFRGRCRHPGLRLGGADRVRLEGGGGYVIDGEMFAPDREFDLRLSRGPELRFMTPAAG